MTTINNLTTTTVTASDLLPVYSTANSDARKVSVSALTTYVLDQISPRDQVVQYAAPLSGETVTVERIGGNTRLILVPTGPIAAVTIALDSVPVELETLSVSCSQTVSAVTLTGGTVSGAPGSIGAATPFTLQYDAVSAVWRRV